jgi:toxin HigB-1
VTGYVRPDDRELSATRASSSCSRKETGGGCDRIKADKIERILARLDEASEVGHMDLPGCRLHRLRGDLAGHWSVTVSANWRIIFRFGNGDASDVDLVDYH